MGNNRIQRAVSPGFDNETVKLLTEFIVPFPEGERHVERFLPTESQLDFKPLPGFLWNCHLVRYKDVGNPLPDCLDPIGIRIYPKEGNILAPGILSVKIVPG